MNRFYIFLLSMVFTAEVVAEEATDSVQQTTETTQTTTAQTTKSSGLVLNADFGMRPGSDYHIRRRAEEVERGSTHPMTKATIRASYPIFKKGYSKVEVGGSYAYYHQEFDGAEKRLVDYGFDDHSHHSMSLNLKGTTYLRLFGKPLMLQLMGRTDFSQYGFERWSMNVNTMLMLIHSKETTLGVGLMGMIHSSARIPVLPLISFRHVFNPQWTINLTMPRFQMEYRPTQSDMLSVGCSLDGDSYYMEPGDETLPKRVNHVRTLVGIGPGYEHQFSFGMTLKAEAGAQWIVTDRLYKNNTNSVVGRVHEKLLPYFRIGIQQKL